MLAVLIARELARAGRDRRVWWVRWLYVGWLALVLYFRHSVYLSEMLVLGPLGQFRAGATADFAHALVDFLLGQQFILVLLIAPSFAAGALTDEKVRGTLELLFLAHLSPVVVVLGKLIARVLQGFVWSLAAWPVIAAVGMPGGVTPIFFVALGIITLLVLTGVCAFSLLASVWARTSRDAMVATYIVLALGCLVVAYAGTKGRRWEFVTALNPDYVLDAAREKPDYAALGQRLRMATLWWVGITVTCTAIAAWRLRPAYIKQLTRKRPWVFGFMNIRPRIGNRPIVWKEQFVSRLPRWLGWLAAGGLSAGLTYFIVSTTPLFAVEEERLASFLWVIGGTVSLAAGVRGSAAIVGERDRRTWDSLISTPDDFERIVNDKLIGIVNSVWPFWFAGIMPPALCVSILNIRESISTGNFPEAPYVFMAAIVAATLIIAICRLTKVAWVPWCGIVVTLACACYSEWMILCVAMGHVAAWAAIRLMAAVGIWVSARSKSGWMALLGTVAAGYVAAMFLAIASTPVGCLFCCSLFVIAGGLNLGPGTGYLTVIQSILLGGGVIAHAWGSALFAARAAVYLQQNDRVPESYARMMNMDYAAPPTESNVLIPLPLREGLGEGKENHPPLTPP